MKHKIIMNSGFTLIEALVALTVVIFAVLGPVTLTFISLKTSTSSKNNFIAGNLAQEGMELIRAKARNNTLACAPSCNMNDWLNDLINNCRGATGCGIDANNVNPEKCNNSGGGYGNECPLRFDGFLYNHMPGSGSNLNTIFKRVIKTQQIQSGIEELVTVSVSWTEKFGNQNIIIEEHMFNWQ
jgi:Tfp pilus assembly protein PilV